MKPVHNALCLRITDPAVLKQFLARWNIDPRSDRQMLVERVAFAFSHIPYENLTKIIKSDAVIGPDSAMRLPDEVLADWLKYNTGGTCFSLTAAIIAVLNALGIETHPVLADRHYGPDTHCGVVIVECNGLVLLDPGFLLFSPTLLPVDAPVFIDNIHNRIELNPIDGGQRVELYTIVKNNRKFRLTYKAAPVDAETFERAWKESFAWEMMHYPVLTRVCNGAHHYLQADRLSIRNAEGAKHLPMTAESTAGFIIDTLGIKRDIALKALEICTHGTATKPPSA